MKGYYKIAICLFMCLSYGCSKKHACDCRYPDGTSYNIIESSNGDCSEWDEPDKDVTCKIVN